MNLTKKENEDYTTFASIVNRECEKFKLSKITPDMFKCLIFVQGLTAPGDAEIRARLLTKLEQDQKITLQNLAEECQRILNLRSGTAKIEERTFLIFTKSKINQTVRKKKLLLKLTPVTAVVNCIYSKIVRLKTKNVKIVLKKDTNILIVEKSLKVKLKIKMLSNIPLRKKQPRL